MLTFNVISLFPDMLDALQSGITGRALKEKQIALHCFNPRDYTQDKHQTVDDRPYGGGPGMLMMVQPLQDAIHAAKKQCQKRATTIFLSPQGKQFNQSAAEQLAKQEHLILVAGRYEGIDQRLIDQEIDQEWSIGDYILTGGELAAMVMIDAITRLLPNVVGDCASVQQDSLTSGLLKYPQYTRPEQLGSTQIPEVLLSGNHQLIQRWRHQQSLGRTWLRRPDLLAQKALTKDEEALLQEFLSSQSK